MNDFKFELGHMARCTITGFEGIITCRSQWMNNCNTYRLQPTELNKDGEIQKAEHFDEPQLKSVSPTAVIEPTSAKERTGGPTDAPVKTNRE